MIAERLIGPVGVHVAVTDRSGAVFIVREDQTPGCVAFDSANKTVFSSRKRMPFSHW